MTMDLMIYILYLIYNNNNNSNNNNNNINMLYNGWVEKNVKKILGAA